MHGIVTVLFASNFKRERFFGLIFFKLGKKEKRRKKSLM